MISFAFRWVGGGPIGVRGFGPTLVAVAAPIAGLRIGHFSPSGQASRWRSFPGLVPLSDTALAAARLMLVAVAAALAWSVVLAVVYFANRLQLDDAREIAWGALATLVACGMLAAIVSAERHLVTAAVLVGLLVVTPYCLEDVAGAMAVLARTPLAAMPLAIHWGRHRLRRASTIGPAP